MTIEEKTVPTTQSNTLLDEPEPLPVEVETPDSMISVSNQELAEPTIPDLTTNAPIEMVTAAANPPVESRAPHWSYFIAGMGLTLLAVALGAVLGYLARPSLDSPAAVVAAVPQPSAGVESVAGAPAPVPQAAAPSADSIVNIVQNGGHSQGSADAPVVIVEYADFQCPYCGRHYTDVESRIKDTYVTKGQVRLIYKHYAFLGQESVWAALASECAGEQNKFWEYHNLLFSRQNGENQGAFNSDILKSWAVELKLDTKAFNECLDSGKYLETVRAETTEGQQLGIRGTPGFFVNDVPISGAESFEVFQQIIGEKLKTQ